MYPKIKKKNLSDEIKLKTCKNLKKIKFPPKHKTKTNPIHFHSVHSIFHFFCVCENVPSCQKGCNKKVLYT